MNEIVEYDGRGITPPDQLPKDAPKTTEEALQQIQEMIQKKAETNKRR